MITKVYYIENTNTLDKVLSALRDSIPCFIKREFIEMNYSVISILARAEDILSVERALAPLV